MALTLRQTKGSKLTIAEMDSNLEYLQGLSISGSASGSTAATASYAVTASYATSASYEINYETSSSYAQTSSLLIGNSNEIPIIKTTNFNYGANHMSGSGIFLYDGGNDDYPYGMIYLHAGMDGTNKTAGILVDGARGSIQASVDDETAQSVGGIGPLIFSVNPTASLITNTSYSFDKFELVAHTNGVRLDNTGIVLIQDKGTMGSGVSFHSPAYEQIYKYGSYFQPNDKNAILKWEDGESGTYSQLELTENWAALYASTDGADYTELSLYNNAVTICTSGSKYASLTCTNLSNDRSYQFPDSSGIIALETSTVSSSSYAATASFSNLLIIGTTANSSTIVNPETGSIIFSGSKHYGWDGASWNAFY